MIKSVALVINTIHISTLGLGGIQIILTLYHTGIFGNTDTEDKGCCFQTPLMLCNPKVSNAKKYM